MPTAPKMTRTPTVTPTAMPTVLPEDEEFPELVEFEEEFNNALVELIATRCCCAFSEKTH